MTGLPLPLQVGFGLGGFLGILSWVWTVFMTYISPWVGVVSVLYFVATRWVLPQISAFDLDQKLAIRTIGRGSRMLGTTLVAVMDDDGIWQLYAGEWDADNGGYWVTTAEGRQFYSAEGVGGDPGRWYGGTNLAVAYSGLASLAAPVSAEIGRQVNIKRRVSREVFPGVAPATKELLERWGVPDALERDPDVVTDGSGLPDDLPDDDPDLPGADGSAESADGEHEAGADEADDSAMDAADVRDAAADAKERLERDLSATAERTGEAAAEVAERASVATATAADRMAAATRSDLDSVDGGGPLDLPRVEHVDHWEVTLPEKKVVDMRDTLANAPFNLSPELVHRVRQNAREGQRGLFGDVGPIGQAGLLMGAAMLGGILVYMGMSGGGGGAAGVSLPVTTGLWGW